MIKISSPASGGIPSPLFRILVEVVEEDQLEQAQSTAARIPPELGGIQINFCKSKKNPTTGH